MQENLGDYYYFLFDEERMIRFRDYIKNVLETKEN